jgi:hypothetical protein
VGGLGTVVGMSEMFGDSVYEGGEAVEDAEEFNPTENLTGFDPDEDQETGYSPPDRETENLRERLTPAEERQGHTLDDELAAEVPDVGVDDIEEEDPRAGRLVAPEDGLGERTESDEIAEDVGPAGYASSAEEAAVHLVDEDVIDEDPDDYDEDDAETIGDTGR